MPDITGSIGKWLDAEFDNEVPPDVISLLKKAYELSVKEYDDKMKFCEVFNMKRYIPRPTLKNYVARYNMDKMLLEKHPEQKELLEKRIKRHEQDIVAYVTSKHFECALNNLNL